MGSCSVLPAVSWSPGAEGPLAPALLTAAWQVFRGGVTLTRSQPLRAPALIQLT